MKVQLVRLHEGGKQEIVRSFCHSEEIIIQRTRVKIVDLTSGQIQARFVLEGLGTLCWIQIPTTGNFEIFAQILVGPEITEDAR